MGLQKIVRNKAKQHMHGQQQKPTLPWNKLATRALPNSAFQPEGFTYGHHAYFPEFHISPPPSLYPPSWAVNSDHCKTSLKSCYCYYWRVAMGITPWLIYKSSTYKVLRGTHAKFHLIAKIMFLNEEIDSGEGKQAPLPHYFWKSLHTK